MNFKKIELVGFKSFADKTPIDFTDGITAIVGPNGCGKSNVADAVRWVLGEQSSKRLRSSNMQDVIFNGTEKRKSLSYCEVSLYLDNSQRTVDLDYDEIVLSRKLYRSGDSEYLVNKQSARLKDIVSILHDCGIGRDGYSIIGQGRVEEIVSSKPEDRRTIFEEAAGISKFKEKKLESERKLARTRDNLSRVKDIIYEIERKLNPLKEQAEKARKYLSLKENLKSLEINNYIYQYDSIAARKEEINLRISAIEEELLNKQNDLDVTNSNYASNFESMQKIDETINELYNELTNLKVAIEKKSGEANIQREKLALLKNQAMKFNSDLDREQQNLHNITEELDLKTNQQKENVITVENLKQEADNLNDKYHAVVDELTKSEEDAEQNQQQMISALDKLSDIKADISKLNQERINCVENQRKLTVQIENEKNKLNYNSNILKDTEAKLSVLNSNKNSLVALKDSTQEQLSKLNHEIATNNIKYNTTLTSLSSAYSRKKILEEMQKSFDGFNGAVKHILQESERNPKLKQEFIGVVANLIKTPKEYETAIEMALGNAVQNIVTQNEDNAKNIINYLKQNNFGRATFLPITSMKARNVNDYLKIISSTKGCYGVASKLVSFDSKYSNVFENLLGSTVITDNMDTAIMLARSTRNAFKIVTLDGEIVNPQGSITGGSKKFTVSNVVGREREIEETNALIQKLEKDKETLNSVIDNLQKEIDNATSKLNDCNNKIHNIELDIVSNTELKNQTNEIVEEVSASLEQAKNELSETLTKIKAIDISLEQSGTLQNSINNNKTNANESIVKRQQTFENLKKERDEYNSKVMEIKVKIASLESENIALENDILRLQSEKEETTNSIEEIKNDLNENAKTMDIAQKIIDAKMKDDAFVELNSQLKDAQDKLDNLDNYKKNLQAQIKVLEEDKQNLIANITKLRDKKFQEELNLSKIDTDIENMQERIWTEYELTYASALQFKVENYDLNQGLTDANKTKREIDRLGYVNVNAIEDSKLEQERYDELTIQCDDLLKAEEDLTNIIQDLSNEMLTRFTAAFNQISENFTKTFKELFGGGNAKLELTEPESGDLLDAGVDIIAEPPGKKLQNITLLSGGEKALTAIAILFSILKLKPMPFVILDEIEAALDDANVGRFAKYLKRFSGETQFIVITHRKPTMELADRLYGVTMEEKGVSKVLSVELSDAVQNATTGGAN